MRACKGQSQAVIKPVSVFPFYVFWQGTWNYMESYHTLWQTIHIQVVDFQLSWTPHIVAGDWTTSRADLVDQCSPNAEVGCTCSQWSLWPSSSPTALFGCIPLIFFQTKTSCKHWEEVGRDLFFVPVRIVFVQNVHLWNCESDLKWFEHIWNILKLFELPRPSPWSGPIFSCTPKRTKMKSRLQRSKNSRRRSLGRVASSGIEKKQIFGVLSLPTWFLILPTFKEILKQYYNVLYNYTVDMRFICYELLCQ